jgi:hypothetical protein
LNRVARSLPKRIARRSREILASFAVPGISAHSISSSLSAVQSLLNGMVATCAKRRARPVLELVAAESSSADLVLADLIIAEGPVVLGRAIYGSFEILEQILRMAASHVSLFLNDKDGGSWGTEWPVPLQDIVGAERILPVRSKRLLSTYMEDVLVTAAERHGKFCLLMYGSPQLDILHYCCQTFDNVVIHGNLPNDAPRNCWQMQDFSDRMHFDLRIRVALLLCSPDAADSVSIDQLLSADGVVITNGYFPRFERHLPDRAILRLDPNDSYRGQMDRWSAISNLMKSSEPSPVVTQ